MSQESKYKWENIKNVLQCKTIALFFVMYSIKDEYKTFEH